MLGRKKEKCIYCGKKIDSDYNTCFKCGMARLHESIAKSAVSLAQMRQFMTTGLKDEKPFFDYIKKKVNEKME
jgi:hypothetical protein